MNKQMFLVGVLALSLGGCCMNHHHAGYAKGGMEEKEGEEKGEKKEKKENETEVKVTVDQLPAPVKATMQKEIGGEPITDAEKETEDGKTTYEAHTKMGGSPYVIKVSEDGTLLELKLKEAKKAGEEKDKDDADDEKGEKDEK